MVAQIRLFAGVLTAFAAILCLDPATASAQAAARNSLASPTSTATPSTPTPDAAGTPVKPEDTKPHDENGIVALVNDLPITSYELRQRMALVMSTSRIPDTPEMRKRVHDQVLERLETELLQRQEAAKNDITVSSVEVDRYIQGILDENRMTKDQLKEMLGRGKVTMATFRSQIAAQLLWQKAVQERYAGRVNIPPEAIDAEMARIREGQDRAHFAVSEIFLPVDNPDLDDKVRKDADNIVSQIKAGAPFPEIARQFSQNPTAAAGGDIGTVYDGQLAPELNKALEKMKTGEMSEPIRAIGGYYILLLRQRYEPMGTKVAEVKPANAPLPTALPLGRILLRMPANPPKEYLVKVMEIAEQIRAAVPSCEVAAKVPEKVPGALYFSLGTVRLADLSQQARDALAKTESGEFAAPYRSDAGIELLVRCDPRAEKVVPWSNPTREQITQQLFEDQISALARRYNRDLRRNADIEVR